MNTTLTFTRYLYNLDEVILSGLECLLKHNNLEECYFWFYEIYSSGYVDELWNILWKIYYDFYAEKNGHFERKMKQYYRGWKNKKSFKQVMNVLRTLRTFHKRTSGRVFMMRVFYSNILRQILSEKNREKLKSKDRKFEILKYGLIENKDAIVGYYLKRLYCEENIEKIKKIIEDFKGKKILLNDNYDDIVHQLYYHSIKEENKNKKKNITYNVSQDAVNDMKSTDDTCYNESKYGEHVNTVYKTLALRRKYGISSNIGCFKLARDSLDLNNEFWYHWEYYAYNCPLWKSRFDKYKIKVDNEKKEIVFEDEDEFEEFYELYQYEPDEQSKDTQEKSTKVLKKRKLNEWLEEVGVELSRQHKIRKKLKY